MLSGRKLSKSGRVAAQKFTGLCYTTVMALNLTIEVEQEDDGRWIAEVPALPGVMVYGGAREEAVSRVQALALRVLADRLENGEPVPQAADLFSVVP